MDRRPAPMVADYGGAIASGGVWVAGDPIVGVIVVMPTSTRLLIENVCVDPDHQGLGLGRGLLAFAERHALLEGLDELELYTNEVMAENIELYRHLGYDEVERRTEDGYRRVYLRKRLA